MEKVRCSIYKIIMLIAVAFMALGMLHVSAEASQRIETTGTSLGKEIISVERVTYNVAPGIWKQNDKGWWYEYADGSYPKSSWRKIDGAWYYFDSVGYWVNDNSCERNTLKGIDVSAWQERIDWQAVKNDGIQFAFVRIGHGTHVLDTYYQYNMRNANAVGIPVGVYFYSTAQNEAEAVSDAQFVIQNMKGYLVSYPVVIDLEDSSQDHLSSSQIGKIAKAYCDEIRAAGYTPMLYCNEYWYNYRIDISQVAAVEKWIARYNVRYDTSIQRGIWQCCSTGRVNGIKENADIDFGNKDYTQIVIPRTGPREDYHMTEGMWIKDGIGWWYCLYEGGYPVNTWRNIAGKWYWFDSRGYMVTGWKELSGNWYYLSGSGAMQTGWLLDGGVWYYFEPDTGIMYANQWLNDTYYFVNSGAMAVGWVLIDGKWYYFNADGSKITNQWNGNYYLKEDGSMAVNEWVDDGRYFVDSNGVWVPNKVRD